MKNIPILALAAVLLASVSPAVAGPFNFLFKQQHQQQHDHHRHEDRRDVREYRDERRRPSIEYRAQLRLRELGYYRGRIDGSFGRRSQSSLARFQRDNRLRPNGNLNKNTLRALRLI